MTVNVQPWRSVHLIYTGMRYMFTDIYLMFLFPVFWLEKELVSNLQLVGQNYIVSINRTILNIYRLRASASGL